MRGLKVGCVLVMLSGSFVAVGCGKQDLSKPPQIHYGRDVCAQCRMIIDDERYASAAVSVNGDILKFDDIGCLAAHEKALKGQHMLRSWVRSAANAEWIEKEKAWFVYSRDLVTPMGYGFAAFKVSEDAAQFAKEKAGRVVAWNELQNLTEK